MINAIQKSFRKSKEYVAYISAGQWGHHHQVLYRLYPIEIEIKYEVAVAAIRLKGMEEWINKCHTTYLQTVIQINMWDSIE